MYKKFLCGNLKIYLTGIKEGVIEIFRLNEFGQMIKELRKKRKMTQNDFAQLLGFTASYISRIESGKANPTLKAIEQMEKKLCIRIFFEYQ
ncbi:XRE family transcriptional regulator [Bacillus velezensis]|uniref:helix-turn-helix domain-containing protein n=1 Tax=Bacillus velezensis TaxID=492670 RepID=UPI0006559F52|nr:helix-turn-helix transcriptional regulator [Bacillus velezensis]AKL77816.1 XRE family transcriptional regulator [Bacillus velezensis]